MSGKLVKSIKIGVFGSLLSLSALLASVGAQAGLLVQDFNALGEHETTESITWSFTSEGGSSTLDFELAGYGSLDGFDNFYTDIFHLSVNGSEVFQGSFNLGGGGSNIILFNPNGGSAQTTTFGTTDDSHNSSQVTWEGGVTQISIPLHLLQGENEITFSYSGDNQWKYDEAWGVNLATVTLPEPAAFSLLFAGLFGLLIGRRIRNK